MILEIITPETKVFDGQADSVQFPGSDGLFQVLNHHAALVAALTKGFIRVRIGAQEKSFGIDGGIVEILNNKVTVLADTVIQ